MSCFVIEKEEYVNFAQTLLYFERTIGENDREKLDYIKNSVNNLYKLNQEAFNKKYNEEYEIDSIDTESLQPKCVHFEETKKTLRRILHFLRCVAYQCNESDELFEKSYKIVTELFYYSSKTILDDDEDFVWGNF